MDRFNKNGEKLIAITNFRQACCYIKDEVQPIFLEYDIQKNKLVFFFDKNDTKEVWEKWKTNKYLVTG